MLAQRIGHVIKDVHVGEQGPRLKEHAHAFANSIQARARHLRDVFAVKEDFTAIRWDLPTNKAEQGRFTDPGRPHDGSNFATRHGQRNIIKYQSVGARKTHPADID